MTNVEHQPLKLLTESQVCEKIALGRVSLWKLRSEGKFPQPVITPLRANRWRSNEVDEWINSLPTTNDEGNHNVH